MKHSIQDIPPINYNPIEVDPKYNRYIKNQINDAIETGDPEQCKRRVASGAAAIGSVLQYIPHPITRGVGAAMQIPDLYYDSVDFDDDPNVTNTIHLLLDTASPIAKYSKPIAKNVLKRLKFGKTPVNDVVTNQERIINGRFDLGKKVTIRKKIATSDPHTILYEIPSIADDAYSAINGGYIVDIPGMLDDGYNAVTNRDLIKDLTNINNKRKINNYNTRTLNNVQPLYPVSIPIKDKYTLTENGLIEKDNNGMKVFNLPPITVYSKHKRK